MDTYIFLNGGEFDMRNQTSSDNFLFILFTRNSNLFQCFSFQYEKCKTHVSVQLTGSKSENGVGKNTSIVMVVVIITLSLASTKI